MQLSTTELARLQVQFPTLPTRPELLVRLPTTPHHRARGTPDIISAYLLGSKDCQTILTLSSHPKNDPPLYYDDEVNFAAIAATPGASMMRPRGEWVGVDGTPDPTKESTIHELFWQCDMRTSANGLRLQGLREEIKTTPKCKIAGCECGGK